MAQSVSINIALPSFLGFIGNAGHEKVFDIYDFEYTEFNAYSFGVSASASVDSIVPKIPTVTGAGYSGIITGWSNYEGEWGVGNYGGGAGSIGVSLNVGPIGVSFSAFTTIPYVGKLGGFTWSGSGSYDVSSMINSVRKASWKDYFSTGVSGSLTLGYAFRQTEQDRFFHAKGSREKPTPNQLADFLALAASQGGIMTNILQRDIQHVYDTW